jgi:hypothetical protein
MRSLPVHRSHHILGNASMVRRTTPDRACRDFGAEIKVWSEFALSRRDQAIRRETGMPRPVMMLMTLQATLASVFCAGRVAMPFS